LNQARDRNIDLSHQLVLLKRELQASVDHGNTNKESLHSHSSVTYGKKAVKHSMEVVVKKLSSSSSSSSSAMTMISYLQLLNQQKSGTVVEYHSRKKGKWVTGRVSHEVPDNEERLFVISNDFGASVTVSIEDMRLVLGSEIVVAYHDKKVVNTMVYDGKSCFDTEEHGRLLYRIQDASEIGTRYFSKCHSKYLEMYLDEMDFLTSDECGCTVIESEGSFAWFMDPV
jgi:hypothetical protein